MSFFHPMLKADERNLNARCYIPLVGTHEGIRRIRSAKGFLSSLKIKLDAGQYEGDLKRYHVQKIYWENHVKRGYVEIVPFSFIVLIPYDLFKKSVLSWTEPLDKSAGRSSSEFNLIQAIILSYKIKKVFDHVISFKTLNKSEEYHFSAHLLKENDFIERNTLINLFNMYAHSKGFHSTYDPIKDTIEIKTS